MMTEKEIVNEAIHHINSSLNFYTIAIPQTENTELRYNLIQMRTQAERSQCDLYQIAKKLNYDIPAEQPSQRETAKTNATNPYHNYISSQSNGILEHIDAHTQHALHASQKSERQ